MTLPRTFRPQVETLGDRALLSATLSNGLLEVVGATTEDTIRVTLADANTIRVTDSGTGEDRTFDRGAVGRILIRARGGDDFVLVGPNITQPAEVRGWSGNDTILGGGGDDTLLGGGGEDHVRGRGGNDDLRGQGGNDDLDGEAGDDRVSGQDGDDNCRGGDGNDVIDGGNGRDAGDGGSGNDDVFNGFDRDTELVAFFPQGQGKAEFKFGPDDGGMEREFEVEVEDLTPNGLAAIFVDGQQVASLQLNSFGDGELEFELDFDGDDDGALDFPDGFPEIAVGSVVSVQVNGVTVREGTFAPSTRN